MNLDGFWASVEGTKERKCDVVVRAAKCYDIIAVADAHISRFDIAAVKEFAKQNGLEVLISIHPPGTEAATKEATAAHDRMHYTEETEGNRAGTIFFVNNKICEKYAIVHGIVEEFYQLFLELHFRKQGRIGDCMMRQYFVNVK